VAYDQQLGQALDFGQVGPPSNPKKNTTPSFMDWQSQTYGNGQQEQQPGKPVQPKTTTTNVMTPPPPPEPTFMPNGQPQVNNAAPQIPQAAGPTTTTKTATTTPAPPPTLGAGLPTQYAGLEGSLAQILQSLATGGGSMNPTVVAQLKGKQKDQSALMSKQNQGALRQALAARGMDVNSGFGVGQQRQQAGNDQANLLDQYRAIDTGAAQTNRADILQSLGPLQSAIYGAYGQQNWLDNMALQYQMLNNQQLSGLFQ
jgi:hypothetical protein